MARSAIYRNDGLAYVGTKSTILPASPLYRSR